MPCRIAPRGDPPASRSSSIARTDRARAAKRGSEHAGSRAEIQDAIVRTDARVGNEAGGELLATEKSADSADAATSSRLITVDPRDAAGPPLCAGLLSTRIIGSLS